MIAWLLELIGIAIVEHSSGALIATGTAGYIAGSMGLLAFLAFITPHVIGGIAAYITMMAVA